MNFNIRTNMYL